jgi:hypothetical protein
VPVEPVVELPVDPPAPDVAEVVVEPCPLELVVLLVAAVEPVPVVEPWPVVPVVLVPVVLVDAGPVLVPEPLLVVVPEAPLDRDPPDPV